MCTSSTFKLKKIKVESISEKSFLEIRKVVTFGFKEIFFSRIKLGEANQISSFMITYPIEFKGELWDIEESDYYNYFRVFCQALVEVKNNEPIIIEFTGEFEFVYNNHSLGFWEIPSHCGLTSIYKQFYQQRQDNKPYKLDTVFMNIEVDNKYINYLLENLTDLSEDSLLTLSKKSNKMTESQQLIELLPHFSLDDKGETPTCSFLDVTDGAQHKVIATTDPVWLIIEDFGQVNKDLIVMANFSGNLESFMAFTAISLIASMFCEIIEFKYKVFRAVSKSLFLSFAESIFKKQANSSNKHSISKCLNSLHVKIYKKNRTVEVGP
ncbi:hypothetical protein H8356DRAFT_1346760 [Neocallimastix lanati (nom. inval.)]|nr:hypothetical protein H8356DRAFT_1346760 [Neocallimastix sp. JGI-2020a]